MKKMCEGCKVWILQFSCYVTSLFLLGDWRLEIGEWGRKLKMTAIRRYEGKAESVGRSRRVTSISSVR